MPLINCKINLFLDFRSKDYVISYTTGAKKFKITDKKLSVRIATLSTQDNTKLLQQLKLGSKCTTNCNKYQSKVTTQAWNSYSDFLIDPSFQEVNRFFVLSFENSDDRKVHTGYYLLKVGIKDYNVIIDGKNFFNQPIKSNVRTYDNIRKIAIGQEMITQLVFF